MGRRELVGITVRAACMHLHDPSIDNYIREGIYPNRGSWPLTLGQESSGIIVELPPQDSPAWSDPEFIRRGFKVGAKVAAVSRQGA